MFRDCQLAVEARMQRGAHVDDVDREVIEPAQLDRDAKGALWLYAWSLQDPQHQRAEARNYLATVSD